MKKRISAVAAALLLALALCVPAMAVDGKCVVCGYQQGRRVYFTRQPENARAKVGNADDYTGGERCTGCNGMVKRYTCQRCGEQKDVRLLRAGGVDGKVIKSANFELSGFALGSTKADIEITPDEATAAAMNIRYDICKQSPVLGGALRDDYVPTPAGR